MSRVVQSLLDLDRDGLVDYLAALDQPVFRARQLAAAVYQRLIFDPRAIDELPVELREALAAGLPILPVRPTRVQVAEDDETRKWLLQLPDEKTVETVLMEYNRIEGRPRRAVCISTQVGCAIGCIFCATGRAGLTRNLSAGEIIGQVLWVARYLADRRPPEAVTNLVFMGQGEPLQNLNATLEAVDRLNDTEFFGLGARHMTISTSGLVPGIRALARYPLQVNLAVSLHAPTDELRTRLVPINVRYPIAEILDACREYIDLTHRRITFEYVLIEEVNDDPALGRALGRLLRGLLAHVNVIPINPIGDPTLRRPSRERVRAFAEAVAAQGVPITVRIEKGVEIAAACGQLRTETGRRGNWSRAAGWPDAAGGAPVLPEAPTGSGGGRRRDDRAAPATHSDRPAPRAVRSGGPAGRDRGTPPPPPGDRRAAGPPERPAARGNGAGRFERRDTPAGRGFAGPGRDAERRGPARPFGRTEPPGPRGRPDAAPPGRPTRDVRPGRAAAPRPERAPTERGPRPGRPPRDDFAGTGRPPRGGNRTGRTTRPAFGGPGRPPRGDSAGPTRPPRDADRFARSTRPAFTGPGRPPRGDSAGPTRPPRDADRAGRSGRPAFGGPGRPAAGTARPDRRPGAAGPRPPRPDRSASGPDTRRTDRPAFGRRTDARPDPNPSARTDRRSGPPGGRGRPGPAGPRARPGGPGGPRSRR